MPEIDAQVQDEDIDSEVVFYQLLPEVDLQRGVSQLYQEDQIEEKGEEVA